MWDDLFYGAMLKFLFITDTHYRSCAPSSRIDDWYSDQLRDLEDVLDVAKTAGAQYIIHGGDFFHTHHPSLKLVGDVAAVLKTSSIPLYTAIGNHDIRGYSLQSVENSGLGVLFSTGVVHRLDVLDVSAENVVLKGAHTVLDVKTDYVFEPEWASRVKIVVSHNYIIPADSMPFGFVHPKDVATNAQLVLCGHYHQPFEYVDAATTWLNPGAISRWSVSERDHRPKGVLVTVESGKIMWEQIFLPHAPSGATLFDIAKHKEQAALEEKLEKFAQQLGALEVRGDNVEELVRAYGASKRMDEAVVSLAVAKVQEAREVLR